MLPTDPSSKEINTQTSFGVKTAIIDLKHHKLDRFMSRMSYLQPFSPSKALKKFENEVSAF